MSDPYEKAKGNRLIFKGGVLATKSKPIVKSKKKKKKKPQTDNPEPQIMNAAELEEMQASASGDGPEATAEYTIDAAKKMKYEELFPVEAKKFSYDPKAKVITSVEGALDDRVKKKADRYCK